MKKLFILLTLIFLTLSCERELEITSDFSFTVKEIDDTEIFINTSKPFHLELNDIKNFESNKTYNFSYEVLSGNLLVKDGPTSLIQTNKYNFVLNENKIYLNLVPQSGGVIKVKFYLSDNNNVIKSQEILVYCEDEDFSFSFTSQIPNPVGLANSNIPFNLEIVNTGLSNSQYQVKYINSGSTPQNNIISINSNVINENQYYTFTPGSITGNLKSTLVGNKNIKFYCKDDSGNEIFIDLLFIVNSNPFDLIKVDDFSVKTTHIKPFNFQLLNTFTQNNYEIKFSSIQNSKIHFGTQQLVKDVWLNLDLLSSNLYEYKYEALSEINDILTVQVKDNTGSIKTITYNITIFKKPIFTGEIHFKRGITYGDGIFFVCKYRTYLLIDPTIYGGATLNEIEIVIKNKITGQFDTFNYSSLPSYILEENQISDSFFSVYNAGVGANNISNYKNQNYSIKIKDSDGIWSNVINGTVVDDPFDPPYSWN